MTDDLPSSIAPLFDRTTNGRSFVPTKARQAGARSGGPGRPSGRRESALPWRAASPPARSATIGTLALVLALTCPVSPVRAQDSGLPQAPTMSEMVTEAAQRFRIPER